MPGVFMDHNKNGGRGPGSDNPLNAISPASVNPGNPRSPLELENGSPRTNGLQRADSRSNDVTVASRVTPYAIKDPPELQHITQGFFPFSKLVNRSVQQCWNDLTDLVNELAEIQVSSQNPSASSATANGKVPGSQSPENVRKKLRALDFAQAKRGEFIKLLVLSQWSRQAADVSRLIDIQNLIRIQHQAYAGALHYMGDMKRDLVQAQVANPDINTALEVLSRGEVVSMPDLGYKPLKTLTPKATLKKLRKIDRIINGRLALQEDIPFPFQQYRVHNGRATFIVPGEFELDLSIGEEDASSQFFFVDIRFLFRPSPSAPAGRIFNELDLKVNDILRSGGLAGCFSWLHNLVLTNKIKILARQALDLTKSLWSNILRVELLHRTLVLQYWAFKPGPKSWLEIGVRRGARKNRTDHQYSPHLGLRWMRDGKEVESKEIELDTENISVDRLLRSVIALHISHILSSAFKEISGRLLYSGGSLSLRAHLNMTEPGDCQLDVQLTASRRLRVAIEPMSGTIILAATPNLLERVDADRNTEKSTVDDIVSRVGRLRCAAAIEEVELQAKMLGFESISPRNVKVDARRVFPATVLRFSVFWNRFWDRNWLLAATSSMDGDNWWVVQSRSTDPTMDSRCFGAIRYPNSASYSPQIICNTLLPVQDAGFSALADLGHCLSGFLAIYANARFLEDMQFVKFWPPLDRLKLGYGFRVPGLRIEYEASKLPQALRIGLPTGFRKKTYIRNTLRLAFHGVDQHSNVAIVVAHGNLSTASQAFAELISKEDSSLVLQKAGTGFAIRLLASPGYPIIVTLLEKLQRLECVLSICDILRQKKMETRSLSLSRIGFAYGSDRELLAQLYIEGSPSWSSLELDPAKLASRTDHLFHLRLGIKFNNSNPHRRIQSSLAYNLNRPALDTGLESLAELLSFTLPLMRSLDRLMANPAYNEPLKMHVTVRSATSFQIHYPVEKIRFQLIAHQHQNQPVWILKDASHQSGISEGPLRHKLQETLYNSNGIGWRGLGNGAFAQPDHVGDLLHELDKCLAFIRSDPALKSVDGKSTHEDQVAGNQATATGSARPVTVAESRDGANTAMTQHRPGVAPQKTDVIMID
ncbi:mediator of RNA polymerase II transcription subunit 14 [Aspergillus venezuelensis]